VYYTGTASHDGLKEPQATDTHGLLPSHYLKYGRMSDTRDSIGVVTGCTCTDNLPSAGPLCGEYDGRGV